MVHMGLAADARALLMNVTAPVAVSHGRGLDFAGGDLPRPVRRTVPTRHGPVRCRVFTTPGADRPGAVVHLHGGGFLMRYPQMDDWWSRFVVATTGLAVVDVDYGVAPRSRYPVAQEQAADVLTWLATNAGDWGLDPDRIAVSGFSAGGNVAASACLQVRDAGGPVPRALLLVVPSLDVSTTEKPSVGRHPMIGPSLLRLVRATYFKDESRRTEPYASPVLAPSLAGLPPTTVVTGELDALRAEGDTFAARLDEVGLLEEHVVLPGRDHYALEGGAAWSRDLMTRLAERLRAALA